MKNITILLVLLTFKFGYAQQYKLPIIDIHLHAYDVIRSGIRASWAGEKDAQALTSPENAEKYLEKVLEQMKIYNITLALTSSTSLNAIKEWKLAAPGKFIGGIQTDTMGMPIVSPDSLKKLKRDGIIEVLGELGFQY